MPWMSTQWTLTPEPTGGIEPVTICRVRGHKGIRYAIRQSGACLSKDGKWDIEPIPSSRDDEWLERFRFVEWEQAAKTVEKYLKSSWGRFEHYKESMQ
jgi:hypothetical protein